MSNLIKALRFWLLVMTIALLTLSIGSVLAHPQQPAQLIKFTNCTGGSSAPFYSGVRVIVVNDTIGAKLLDTTFPVQNAFQARFALFGSGVSTDDYTVQAFAFANADPSTPRLWLIGASSLHC